MTYGGFPEKINGDFDFTQTGGEFPSYWFSEEQDYSLNFRPYKNITYIKNKKERFVFMTFKEAMDFLRKYYIDPISTDRIIRRDNFIKLKDDSFILASSYDTFSDEDFDYYIYDKELNKQYIEYLFGTDPIIEKIYIRCSKGKIKTQKKYVVETQTQYGSYKRYYYKSYDSLWSVPDEECAELKEVYHEDSIYYESIYAFNVKYFLDSGMTNYNDFKEKELKIREKELKLFKEIRKRKEDEEQAELNRKRKDLEEFIKELNAQRLESGLDFNNLKELICYERTKEENILRDIYQEIKGHNLRNLSGSEKEIQDFIDTIIDKVYKK